MSDQINQNETNTSKKKTFFGSTRSKVILSVIILIVTLMAIKGIAVAKHLHKFGDGPEGFIIGRISEVLDLNSTQKAQVEKIKDEIKKKMETKKADRDNMFEEFANEFKKESLDKNKLNEFAIRKDQEHKEMREFMTDKLIEFHSILTPEQRTKAIEEMKNMKEKFHKGKGPGHGHDNDRPDRFREKED